MGREHTAGRRRGHSTIGSAQAALMVLVVGGTALGALLLRSDTDLLAKGRGPLGGNAVVVVGLALLSLVGGFALRGKYRQQVDAARGLNPVEQRLVDGMSRVLLAASLVVPLLILVLHRFDSSGSDEVGGQESPPSPGAPQDLTPSLPPAQHGGHAGSTTHFGLTRVLLGLGIAVLVVVVGITGLRLWRYLTRPPEPVAAATYARLDDEQQRLTQAVAAGRRALLEGTDARAAVIVCYATMEESLADSGVTRRASDSPQDLLERALAGGLPAEAAVLELTALFREARYSTHPMDGGHRDRAAAALDEIAEGLRARESGSDAVAGAL